VFDLTHREGAAESPCDEIQTWAATLVALASDDQDRVAAYAHATGCQPCAEALTEGAVVIAWLDAALATPIDALDARHNQVLSSDRSPIV
jgi:hypothetical protein